MTVHVRGAVDRDVLVEGQPGNMKTTTCPHPPVTPEVSHAPDVLVEPRLDGPVAVMMWLV